MSHESLSYESFAAYWKILEWEIPTFIGKVQAFHNPNDLLCR